MSEAARQANVLPVERQGTTSFRRLWLIGPGILVLLAVAGAAAFTEISKEIGHLGPSGLLERYRNRRKDATLTETAISGTSRARHRWLREGGKALVLSDASVPSVPSGDPHFALYYDPWVRALLKLIPGALERSGVAVTDEDVRMRLSPGTKVYIPRNSIMRVWRTHRGALGFQSWLPHFFGIHTNFSGLWWMNGSTDNLVVIDIDPPATGRVWGVRINPRRLILGLEDPEGFIAEVLR